MPYYVEGVAREGHWELPVAEARNALRFRGFARDDPVDEPSHVNLPAVEAQCPRLGESAGLKLVPIPATGPTPWAQSLAPFRKTARRHLARL